MCSCCCMYCIYCIILVIHQKLVNLRYGSTRSVRSQRSSDDEASVGFSSLSKTRVLLKTVDDLRKDSGATLMNAIWHEAPVIADEEMFVEAMTYQCI